MVTAYAELYKRALPFAVKQLARVKVFNFSSIKRGVRYITEIDTWLFYKEVVELKEMENLMYLIYVS